MNSASSHGQPIPRRAPPPLSKTCCTAASRNFLSFLIFFIILHLISSFLFYQGFLLMRYEVPNKSECASPPLNYTDLSSGCWSPATFKKAVIVVVDALRFDFVPMYNESELEPGSSLFYRNKLPTINELLHKRPEHCYLFRFIADSPTVTMQRLKGLTTGTLPTFIDVGSNFGAPSIAEDNIIYQLAHFNKSTPNNTESFSKNIIFTGDDTWKDLFPNHFYKTYAYPSFNIKDLHTVDNGVIKHLIPALSDTGAGNWDVIIGHLLGVDHVGHRHGPSHPAMSEKLAQVDELVSTIVDMLDNDTILFVMGDHGMTFDGDHGGSSLDELHAALFVYSPRIINSSPVTAYEIEEYPHVSQIDFVPTFSLLMGIPIPYGNLGAVIPELFFGMQRRHISTPGHRDWGFGLLDNFWRLNSVMRVNIFQIRRYLDTYPNTSLVLQEGKIID